MRNMITNDYKVIFTSIALNKIREIYEYISNNLYAEKAAKKLMLEITLSYIQLMKKKGKSILLTCIIRVAII